MNEVFVVPILTPNEHNGMLGLLPPRLVGDDIAKHAAPITASCFESGKLPGYLIELSKHARKRGYRADFISWPDGTRAGVIFPSKFKAAPHWAAETIYMEARTAREHVVFERSQGGNA